MYTLQKSLFFAALMLVLSGCSAQYQYSTQANIDTLNRQIDNQSKTLNEALKAKHDKNQETLHAINRRLKNLEARIDNHINALHQEHNSTLQTLRELIKPQIVYKEVAKPYHHKDKLIVGQVEDVHINPPGLTFEARIDSGAATSSIDARNIEEFERDGQKWVKFKLPHPDEDNTTNTLELPITRYVQIVQSSMPDTTDERIVVTLKLTLGDIQSTSEFTLTNREHMSFSVLIGRNVLKDVTLVDVSAKHLAPLTIKAP